MGPVDHRDHVRLLREGIGKGAGVWADLGSGGGAFTFALAELLGAEAVIHSLDRDSSVLESQARQMSARYPALQVHYHRGDLEDPSLPERLRLRELDGVVAANVLHFVRDQVTAVRRIAAMIRPGGRFVVVEYNADRGSPWVPRPFSYPRWEGMAREAGLVDTRLLATVPSRFLREIYSAASFVPE